jgi:hypothetical protein
MASRRAQPYRDFAARPASPVLDAMRRGTTFMGQNPMDQQRALQRRSRLALLMSAAAANVRR